MQQQLQSYMEQILQTIQRKNKTSCQTNVSKTRSPNKKLYNYIIITLWLIQYGTGKSLISRWFSHQNLYLEGISQLATLNCQRALVVVMGPLSTNKPIIQLERLIMSLSHLTGQG